MALAVAARAALVLACLGGAAWMAVKLFRLDVPEFVRVEAIEERYAPAIAKLHQWAARFDERHGGYVFSEAREDVAPYLGAPEVIGASVERRISSSYREGFPLKDGPNKVGLFCWLERSSSKGRPMINPWRRGDDLYVEYRATAESDDSGRTEVVLTIDANRLAERLGKKR